MGLLFIVATFALSLCGCRIEQQLYLVGTNETERKHCLTVSMAKSK
jgi:hypothetical protein